jgi:TRAP-type C4-dicarboxylate transport system substrate-binding protein
MKATNNEKIIEQLQERLLEQFEEPLHEWVDTIEDQAVFNYPIYFDNGQFTDEIIDETKFFEEQKDWLKEQGYKGHLYFGDFAVKIN